MKQFTFRTEIPHADNTRALLMLQEMGIKNIHANNEQFTFECSTPLKDLQVEMNRLQMQEQYADLHRCWQTLQVGTTPNEKWFKEDFSHIY